MRLTLGSTISTLAKYTFQGSCETDPRVIGRINEARERIMRSEQNWRGKVQRFIFCSSNSCITLPREIETVEAATVCNQVMKMRSPWYDVLDGGPGMPLCGGDAFVDRGDGYVTFTDLDQARNVKVYADVEEEDGVRILIQGFDEFGNRVRTFDETTSAYVDGEYVTIDNDEPQSSTTVFSSIDGLQKPETNGFVRVYAFTAGSAGSPATDITTVENSTTGANTPSVPIVWDGELISYGWTGPDEDQSWIVQLFYEDDLSLNLYTPLQVIQIGSALSAWSWVADEAAVAEQYTGGVIPNTAIPLSALPFALTVDNIVWEEGESREVFIFLYANGETDGEGTLYIFDGALNELSSEVVTIPATPTWTHTPIIPGPYTSITFSGNADMSELLTMPLAHGIHVTQTDIGNLSITIDNAAVPLDWGFSMTVSEILAPDLWQGAVFYEFLVNRVLTAAVAAVPDYLSLMAILHPDETLPSYRRYEVPKLRTACCGGSSTDTTPKQVIVMGKLRYLPVLQNTDFLIIENLGALKLMLLALDAEDKGDLALAAGYEAKAFEILAKELRNHQGDAATSNEGLKMQFDDWSANGIPNLL